MKIKNYKDEISEMGFGILVEGEHAGKPSYVIMSDIKEVEIDNEWVANEGYDYAKCIENENNKIEYKRKARYQSETDPMFFQFQRGIITKDEWLKAIDIIKIELPYIK